MVLRLEDIDSPRVKAGAAAEACTDLRWLGFDWDDGPYIQTERLPLYEDGVGAAETRGTGLPLYLHAGRHRKGGQRSARGPRGSSLSRHLRRPLCGRCQKRWAVGLTPGGSGRAGLWRFDDLFRGPTRWIQQSLAAISWSGNRQGRPLISLPQWWTTRPMA